MSVSRTAAILRHCQVGEPVYETTILGEGLRIGNVAE
jgi:hypothetical protein